MYSMLGGIYKAFSVPILLRTLFAPWKRIVSYPGASLDAKLRAFGDNIVSRAVGFVVRMLVLMTAVVIEFGALVIGSIGIILWPLVPLVIVALIVKAVAG
jgi:hypothetical protein